MKLNIQTENAKIKISVQHSTIVQVLDSILTILSGGDAHDGRVSIKNDNGVSHTDNSLQILQK